MPEDINMPKRKAILVRVDTREPLDTKWRPCIADDELEYANARLQQCRMPYIWRWVDRLTNLSGSINMSDSSHNAANQLCSSSYRS